MDIQAHYVPEIQLLSCFIIPGDTSDDFWDFDCLAAPYWRLYWFPVRRARLILGSRELCPGPEDLILIPPRTPFNTRGGGPLHQFFIHFLAGPPFDAVSSELFRFPMDSGNRRVIEEIATSLPGKSSCDIHLSMLCLRLCVDALCQLPADRVNRDGSTAARMSAALKRMAETNGVVSNAELAALAGMNSNSFIRLFRETVGEAPQRHAVKLRVEKAGLLLENSGKSIEEIAELTGFSDRNHLSRQFHRLYGSWPAEYRKKTRAWRPISHH